MIEKLLNLTLYAIIVKTVLIVLLTYVALNWKIARVIGTPEGWREFGYKLAAVFVIAFLIFVNHLVV